MPLLRMSISRATLPTEILRKIFTLAWEVACQTIELADRTDLYDSLATAHPHFRATITEIVIRNMMWRCSSFAVGDLDFYRSEAYGTFFDHLDHDGGFYYEVSFTGSIYRFTD